MKKLIALTLFVFVGVISFGQSTEEENIQKTMDSEIEAWHNGDTTRLSQIWQHSPDVAYTFYSRNGYYTIKGWDSLHASIQRNYKAAAQSNTELPRRENYKININGNMAWVEYDHIPVPSNDPFPISRSHHYRVLVKDNDQWKTVSQIVTVPESYNTTDQASLEENLNTSGYLLLQQKKMNNAIDIFKLNVKLFPNSWNTYDSLGEAYALVGDKKHAIENYEKSIKLNPKNENGTVALSKLRQQ